MFERHQRETDSSDKDGNGKIHLKIGSIDFICLHSLNENMGLSAMFINSCHIVGTY